MLFKYAFNWNVCMPAAGKWIFTIADEDTLKVMTTNWLMVSKCQLPDRQLTFLRFCDIKHMAK